MIHVTAVGAIQGGVSLLGGVCLALAGWSALSINRLALWHTLLSIDVFAMISSAVFGAMAHFASDMSPWIHLGISLGAGAVAALLGQCMFPVSSLALTGCFFGILSAFVLLADSYAAKVFQESDGSVNQVAAIEFVIALTAVLTILSRSSSKTDEIESHRMKYVVFSSVVGGYMVSDGVLRVLGLIANTQFVFSIMGPLRGDQVISAISSDTLNLLLFFVPWGSIALFGVFNQLSMRWGLCWYNRVDFHRRLQENEKVLTMKPGDTLPAQRDSMVKKDVVCSNCFAPNAPDVSYCTECGEPLGEEDEDNGASVSVAKGPGVSLNDSKVPERWTPAPSRPQFASTSIVSARNDASLARNADMSFAGASILGRSVRFGDAKDEKGNMFHKDSMSMNMPNMSKYNQSFISFGGATFVGGRAAEPVRTPNVRKYFMSGTGIFRLFYVVSILAGMYWVIALFFFYPQENPCDYTQPRVSCTVLDPNLVRNRGCRPSTREAFQNGDQDPPCVRNNPWLQWVAYVMFVFSEAMNFFLGLLFNFSMWKPVRRGARYLNDFSPSLPKEMWPTVDVLLCHYMEPVEDTLRTLKACLAMQYPPELLRIWILDDGYCKSTWDANNHFKVTVNMGVIKQAGDCRGEISRLMHEKVVGPTSDDNTLKSWRRQHTFVRELKKDGARGVSRRDCAVGSISDDYDYRDRGIPRVTYVGRMKPEVHHSKAGNINNALFNEGADGKYLMILDNDMKPHPKFLLAVLPFFFSEGEDINGVRQYSDDISWNQVAYVQTPQYFDETPQLVEMGDPCGHRNTIFFDAVQCGRDGYDSAAFAGTNAVFRRQALDSIGGIQYGTQTEDAWTGNVLHEIGWDSLYFRKDFEGDAKQRIRLCEGAVPETVASAMGQRKRWAKGAIQILLMDKHKSEVDPDWDPPRVPAPDPKPGLRLPRTIFFLDSVLYPFGSIAALCYMFIAIYYLCSGNPPIFTGGNWMLYTFLPYMTIKWLLNLLANRAVDNNDVWRAQQTWFSYAFCTILAITEAFHARITGKEKSWANTGAGQKTSVVEIPNILVFITLSISMLVGMVRFFEYENATAPWNFVAAAFFGAFIMSQLWPMVRMSIREYAGWDQTTSTFSASVVGTFVLIAVVVLVQVWETTYAPNLINSGQARVV